VRLVGSPPSPLDFDGRRALPSLLEPALVAPGSRHEMSSQMSPSQEDAIKVWASTAYALPLDDIEQVTFDVQYANLTDPREPHLQLEIDVRMADGHQHLFTRCVCEFGQIVDEVLDVAR
jgi:hypothetical protein